MVIDPEVLKPVPMRCNKASDLALIRAHCRRDVSRLIHKYLQMPVGEISSLLSNVDYVETLSVLEVAILSIASKAVMSKDTKNLEFLLTRLIGRPRTEIDVSHVATTARTLEEIVREARLNE